MYLLSAGNDQKAGKPDHPRDDAHDKGNKHADDNLLHDIPFILPTSETRLSALAHPKGTLHFNTGFP